MCPRRASEIDKMEHEGEISLQHPWTRSECEEETTQLLKTDVQILALQVLAG